MAFPEAVEGNAALDGLRRDPDCQNLHRNKHSIILKGIVFLAKLYRSLWLPPKGLLESLQPRPKGVRILKERDFAGGKFFEEYGDRKVGTRGSLAHIHLPLLICTDGFSDAKLLHACQHPVAQKRRFGIGRPCDELCQVSGFFWRHADGFRHTFSWCGGTGFSWHGRLPFSTAPGHRRHCFPRCLHDALPSIGSQTV